MKTHPLLRFLTIFAAAFLLAASARAQAPNISVEQPAGTTIAHNGTKAFGDVQLGSSLTLTFTVRNTGTANLTLAAPLIDGTDAGQFSATTPSTPVTPGSTATFNVTFTPATVGGKTARVRIPNNGPGATNPYDINLTGTGTTPDYSASPVADAGMHNFGNVVWGGTPGSVLITFTNTGTAPLTLGTPSIAGGNASEFSATTPSSPVAPGATSSFTVTCTPTSRGAKVATLSIVTNVIGAKNPYNITLNATGIAPVMEVSQDGTSIPNNGSRNFGSTFVNVGQKLLFTIANTGDSGLTGLSITKDGANAGDYIVTAVSPGPPISGPGGTTTFEVNFLPQPGPGGNRTAAIHIASNDPSVPGGQYNITLNGNAVVPQTGSDAYGYQMNTGEPIDTVDLLLPDGVTPAADAVEATLLVGDDVSQSINLGFGFNYYDRNYTTCVASTNGLLMFAPGPGVYTSSYVPRPIPSSSGGDPTNFIAPFWTDLYRVTDSKILYATRGQIGNRVFILQFNKMAHYSDRDVRVTFALKLYEGSNTIEFQYKTLAGGALSSLASSVTRGIQSRNFTTDPDAAGLLSGTLGIQVAHGALNAGNIPPFPSAVKFTRPVAIKVESKFTDAGGTPFGPADMNFGLNPGIGTYYSGNAFGSVKRFEAPPEIFLDRNYAPLANGAGDVDDPPADIAWYRLVFDGYSIDGQIIQGAPSFFTVTLNRDITVVWRWRLEYAVIVEQPVAGQPGFGNPDPAAGRIWLKLGQQFNASLASNVVDEAGGTRLHTTGYRLFDKNDDHTLLTTGTTINLPDDAADRRDIVPISMMAPLRLKWNLIGQVRYRFDSFSSETPGVPYDGHSFLRVYGADRITPDANYGTGGIVYGVGENREVWITTGTKVDVGAFYRSSDGKLTLSSFVGTPSGDLGSLNSVSDATEDEPGFPAPVGPARVARVFTVRSVAAPSAIHWNYLTTVFRAEVPIGKSLDALDPNTQLSPALPVGATLRVTDAGPGMALTVKRSPVAGSVMTGDPLRWDRLGKALFPVHTGVYEIAWPDSLDETKSYRVEVLTGYPGDTVQRTFSSETGDGTRILLGSITLLNCNTTDGSTTVACSNTAALGTLPMRIRGPNIPTGATIVSSTATTFELSAPATGTATGLSLTAWTGYQNTVVLPEIDPALGFPAQPHHAHYRYLFDAEPKRAPTRLDLSTVDEWKFKEMPFSDSTAVANADTTQPGVPFTASGAGRSVLLYSYRPNSDEVADGNPDQENLAVRIVRSSPVSAVATPNNPVTFITRADSRLVLGRKGLQLGGGPAATGGAFGLIGPAGTLEPDNQFVVDFWLNAKGLQSSAAVTLTNCVTNGTVNVTCASTAGLVAGMSISGKNIAPGTKVAAIGTNGTSFTLTAAATAAGSNLTLTASYSAVTLTDCVTDVDSTTVTCASTADVVAGMNISGPNIVPGTKIAEVTDATTLVLSAPATGQGTSLTLTTSNKPVTVLTSGGGGLKVTLDAEASTVTATYMGIPVTHTLSKAGASWRHYVIHVFNQEVFGTGVTVVDFYLDGAKEEQARPVTFGSDAADSTITDTQTFTADSFRFGVDADPQSNLQLDQFRLFTFADFATDDTGYLTAAEIRQLKNQRDMTTNATDLRDTKPRLWFSFETAPSGVKFLNQGVPATPGLGIGPVLGATPFAGTWANVDVQEVATRIDSTLDDAGFGGSGYVRNAVSNYNASLYTRTAEVGTWGPIFPVNHRDRFADANAKLEVVYYENPYRVDRVPHPNVAWPYVVTEYNDVTFPAIGPHKDKAIYIASRIGSEGVDQTGRPQKVFDLAQFSGLQIYNQPDVALPGYNPNEEHALVAPSGRAALKVKNLGEALANNPPLAAFALQKDINNKPSGTSTSEPWVLVQVNNLATGEPEMAAYQVFSTRSVGTASTRIAFPRPADAKVGGSTGLAYEPASNPEDRFLTLAPGVAFNFEYLFDYPVFAGDLLVPPYPLNLAIGNASLNDARGGNIQVGGVNQRTLWIDAGLHAWVVSGGGGKFFYQYFYPMRSDFYLPGAALGKPVAWLPNTTAAPADFLGDNVAATSTPGSDDNPKPVKVNYTSAWRSDYPKLKRGETLTYQGGEFFNENPGSNGLPALVAMQAAEIVFDSATPSMVPAVASKAELDKASARIIRPLDRREVPFTNAQMIAAGLKPGDPATSKVIVRAERWYFKELTGSLQKRFYFNTLEEKLVFRGRLNDKEGGDPELTLGPDPVNVLEPNVMTLDDYKQTAPSKGLIDLATTSDWTTAINNLFALSQSPNGLAGFTTSLTDPVFLQGIKPVPVDPRVLAILNILKGFWTSDLSNFVTSNFPFVQLDSFGVGSALVPNASLLTQAPTGSLYVTIAENNRPELADAGAPVSLHIIEIIPDRYRGAIYVHEGADAFSEKITLQHNGEFGANTGDLDYEWWIRDSRELDDTLASEIASLTSALPDPDWQLYKFGRNLHTVVFEGRPDVILADKLVLMRYRHKDETKGWNLVPFELPTGQTASAAWQPGSATVNAPFQWAGAANSPQLQADGSKRYIPQLVMGWVKRVLDRLNPYEARYTDFFSNESPATYSSMIQIAGAPYAGNVALNPDKNVIENVGLIELYRTVLARARSLSIDNSSNGNPTPGINQAILLAATRLAVLYDLLGREAYSDAQDGTISVPDDSGLASAASFTFAFQNMEPTLLSEELALLRGSDFRKSYPVYNRMFWNYAKGLGEAAYNVNYGIYDVNQDGFINESDARRLFPQGHGDAWGHYLSALDMHYVLLQHPTFSWAARAELYSLLQNVLPVDYLDEKTFAKIAAGRARAGRDIVRATYRLNYSADPDGQYQGYTDGVDKARAWGVSEWAHRAGQGAYFDWAIANAILPEQALDPDTGKPLQNLSEIERQGAVSEIGELAAGMHEIQVTMDEANSGVNPLGLDSDALSFDIDPFYDGVSWERKPHFEQIYDRAVMEGKNAVAVLQFATQANNKLRAIADDTDSLIVDSLRQDLDYRNRLIEIFGTPYTGQIGFGKAYPEGYVGPDTLLYAYLDKITIDKIVIPGSSSSDPANTVTFTVLINRLTGSEIMNSSTMMNLFNELSGSALADAFDAIVKDGAIYRTGSLLGNLSLTYNTASRYGFEAPADWGQRTSFGKTQVALKEMLTAEIGLDTAITDYVGFLADFEQKIHRLQVELEIFDKKEDVKDAITGVRAGFNSAIILANGITQILATVETGLDLGIKGIKSATDDDIVVGLANTIPNGPIQAAVVIPLETGKKISETAVKAIEFALAAAGLIRDEVIAKLGRDIEHLDQIKELEGLVEEIENMTANDRLKRNAIGMAGQELEMKWQEYLTAQSEGFRLLREREAFNKVLAAKVQKNRYQDMIFRLTRNEAMSKYQSAFNNAARYAWLAARAYDYETSLDPGDPAAPGELFNRIVRERQLGLWGDEPQQGQGGLAEILAQMNANFQVLKGQLGITNPQQESEKISLRSELFRIGPTLDPEIEAIPVASRTPDQTAAANEAAASAARLVDTLKARIVPDLYQVPEFVRYCRPFSTPAEGPQPGLVIRFSTEINNGVNVFGNALVAGDHKYSTANYATKLRAHGVWVANYNAAGLATSPRAYLVPIGNDYLRTSSNPHPFIRAWSVREQRIPVPFVINQGQISAPGYIPTLDGIDGGFGEVRRHGDFRMYHDNGDPEADGSELIYGTRLASRSVWNSEWMLVIPGASLGPDPMEAVTAFAENVTDILLFFDTYSPQGR